MTVNATNVFTGPFFPNGLSATFPFDFEVSDEDEVSAMLNGVEVDQSLFSVNLNDGGTGEVVFFTPPAGDGLTDELYIFSDPDFRQSTTLANQGPYYQKTLEGVLDKLAIRLIWLRDRILRVPTLPFTFDASTVGKFPIVLSGGGWGFSSGPGGGTDALRDDLSDPSVGPNIIAFDQGEAYGEGSIGELILTRIDVTKPPFNAQGNGSNEKAILQAAYALAETLDLPLYLGKDKTYNLGTMSGTVEEVVFGNSGPPAVVGENVTFEVSNHASTPKAAYIFLYSNFQGRRIEGVTVECTNPDFSTNTQGILAFGARTGASGASGLTLKNCVAKNVLAGFFTTRSGQPASFAPRVKGIHLDNFVVENCYYGVNPQNEGDDLTGTMTIINPRRAYFAYGVSGHNVDVHVKVQSGGNTYGADACVPISKDLGLFTTGAMNVRVTFEGDTSRWTTLIATGCKEDSSGVGGKCGPLSIHCDLDPVAAANSSGQYRLDITSFNYSNSIVDGLSNEWTGGISVSGNFMNVPGDSSDVSIRRRGTTVKQLHVNLAPSARVCNWATAGIDKDVVFHLSSRRELRVHRGTVSGIVMKFPLPSKGNIYQLKHKVYAWGDGGGAFGNSTYREDVIIGSVAWPGGEVYAPVQIACVAPGGAGNRISCTYGGEVGAALLTFGTSTDYDTGTGFAMVETEYGDQQG